MPITNNTDQIAPSLIVVGDRQRSETKTDGLIDSIRQYGILVSLIVRREFPDGDGLPVGPTQIVLVAGRRRLACAIELNLDIVPVRYYDTLDPLEAKIIELEENIKREDLPWRDQVCAIGELHTLKKAEDPDWTSTRTAELISYSDRQTRAILSIYSNLESPAIAAADNLAHAIGILQRLSERRAASIVEELLRVPSNEIATTLPGTFTKAEGETALDNFHTLYDTPTDLDISLNLIDEYKIKPEDILRPGDVIRPIEPVSPVINTDFIEWASNYSGPKFNLIHCDLPYGVHAADATIEHYENTKELFWALTNALTGNIDKILSYSAHVMFWLSFEYYEQVKTKLSAAGLHVINRPLIWVRSDSRGAAPGIRGTQPRHSYEIALLAYRGNRPLVRQGTDSYSAQTVTSPIHPTQKPESMLKHFLSMLIDNVTDFLDPTCGSGSALCAADYLGARTVVGLEKDPIYASAANAMILRARRTAELSKQVAESQEPTQVEL